MLRWQQSLRWLQEFGAIKRLKSKNRKLRSVKNYAVVIVHIVHSNADSLSLRAYRSGTKLENTSLSTDGKQGSAYGMYNMHNLKLASMSFVII